MSTAHNPIKLYETVVDECPYLEGKQSASILVDPEHQIDKGLFAMLSRSGFRRSGEMLYSPKCPSCNACISVRVPAAQFIPSRSQKRVWRKNLDLKVRIEDVSYKEEHFDLYLQYQRARHPDSSMCDDDPKKYTGFIDSHFSKSKFLCLYLNDKLMGVSVLDQFEGGLSAVYTFFDPQYSNRSIGTYVILYLLKLARLKEIPHVYLGYWIEQSSKMSYKQNFKPLQGYVNRQWIELNTNKTPA
ncbi:MAG: arginyl-tRNA--protein-N-Asp/Glu arginylyltransferase [Arenicella sp.]|jgi:arginyl-tRNA--protein-N-Asp/Glu arginylyltransferase